MKDDRIATKIVYVTPEGHEFPTEEAALCSLQTQEVIKKCGFTFGTTYTAAELIGRILHYYDLKARP